VGPADEGCGDDPGGGVIAFFALLLATSFPSANKTSWMRPDAFHLVIGMTRADTVNTLESHGWKPKKGDDANHLVVIYTEDKSLTLQFKRDRLRSIRFELFTILHEAAPAFDEEKSYLLEVRGAPKKMRTKSVLLYDDRLPNVMVVLANDPKSEHAQRGLGFLVVRYYDPR
jgi:hypothetical protein